MQGLNDLPTIREEKTKPPLSLWSGISWMRGSKAENENEEKEENGEQTGR